MSLGLRDLDGRDEGRDTLEFGLGLRRDLDIDCDPGALVLSHGVAPVIGNYLYDLTKSYEPALWMAVPCCGLTVILMASLGRYPKFIAAE